jgi:beta-1,4-mannosyl-glycoprotein beta-1,4-N-acetylglucosaminyltransferase
MNRNAPGKPMSNENKPRVYDMFPFFNELELLEIRLNELDPVVDVFVLAEARHTFQKKPKELVFEKNKERFAKFLPKIRHVVVDDLPGFFYKWRRPDAWVVSDYQKGQVVRGLYDARPGDTLIFSDVDEIPKAAAVAEAAGKPGVTVFEQRFYAYYLNNICTDYDTHGVECVAQYNRDGLGWWRGSVMIDFAGFQKIGRSIKKLRLLHDVPEPQVTVMNDAGWHFTSIGDVERIALKLESYEHSEANTDENKNPVSMRRRIQEGKSIFLDNKSLHKFVPLDQSFPGYLVQNRAKFANLIAPT